MLSVIISTKDFINNVNLQEYAIAINCYTSSKHLTTDIILDSNLGSLSIQLNLNLKYVNNFKYWSCSNFIKQYVDYNTQNSNNEVSKIPIFNSNYYHINFIIPIKNTYMIFYHSSIIINPYDFSYLLLKSDLYDKWYKEGVE